MRSRRLSIVRNADIRPTGSIVSGSAIRDSRIRFVVTRGRYLAAVPEVTATVVELPRAEIGLIRNVDRLKRSSGAVRSGWWQWLTDVFRLMSARWLCCLRCCPCSAPHPPKRPRRRRIGLRDVGHNLGEVRYGRACDFASEIHWGTSARISSMDLASAG